MSKLKLSEALRAVPRRNKGRGAPLSARELASVLIELIEVGLVRRTRGTCIGSGVTAKIMGPGRRTGGPTLTQICAAVFHAKWGHDPGCYAFGVSLGEILRVLARVDRVGATPLILEACREAAAEVCKSLETWNRDDAKETFELHVRRRITPVSNSKR